MVIAAECRRKSIIARAKAKLDSGSASWAWTVRPACSAAAGSQGVPVVKPSAWPGAHGMGVRQPSRPPV